MSNTECENCVKEKIFTTNSDITRSLERGSIICKTKK